MLVDTSYPTGTSPPRHGEAEEVAALIREDRAVITGIVLAELLQGARTERELSELRSGLGAVGRVETTADVYARAGRFGLRRRGSTVPVTDCVIAAAAETIGGRVLTLDDHFGELAEEASLRLSRDRP